MHTVESSGTQLVPKHPWLIIWVLINRHGSIQVCYSKREYLPTYEFPISRTNTWCSLHEREIEWVSDNTNSYIYHEPVMHYIMMYIITIPRSDTRYSKLNKWSKLKGNSTLKFKRTTEYIVLWAMWHHTILSDLYYKKITRHIANFCEITELIICYEWLAFLSLSNWYSKIPTINYYKWLLLYGKCEFYNHSAFTWKIKIFIIIKQKADIWIISAAYCVQSGEKYTEEVWWMT